MSDQVRQTDNVLARFASTLLELASRTYVRFASLIGVLIFLAYVVITIATAYILPEANWDMLPYLAVAEEAKYPDPVALHDFAYGAVKAAVPAADYEALTNDGGGFRTHMAENPTDFVSLLGMYRVKFLYGQIISVVSTFVTPVAALRLVSAFSAVLFAGFVLAWLRSAAWPSGCVFATTTGGLTPPLAVINQRPRSRPPMEPGRRPVVAPTRQRSTPSPTPTRSTLPARPFGPRK